jgi:ATP-dependent RNA helicase DeaD
MGFTELGLHEALADKLTAAGINEPSDVQSQALPQLIAGKDGVIVSPTGTGKTLAYLLPLLQKLDGTKRETQAVILAPTQELAMQIMREAEIYGQPLGIKATALIGGASLARQLERMKGKPALIVGTPGRVREVATTRKLSLHNVIGVVVDETDRIFSLGGRSDVENIMRQCNRDRQTVFVSATRSEAMRDAEKKWLKDPWVSDPSETENENGLSSTLEHWYFLTDPREKIDLIRKIVRNLKPTAALLFVNETDKIGELLAKLRYEGFAVDALYGDTPGRERGEVMQRFRKGRSSLLIATDVAARGLDLPGLPLVIQFEPALDADHYVHRSGRTARMGNKGTSITLISPQQRFIIDKLEKQLKIEIHPKVLYEGRAVSLEEGNVKPEAGAARKPQASGGVAAKDTRPTWKSKSEYLASLEQKNKPGHLKAEEKLEGAERPTADRKPTDGYERKPGGTDRRPSRTDRNSTGGDGRTSIGADRKPIVGTDRKPTVEAARKPIVGADRKPTVEAAPKTIVGADRKPVVGADRKPAAAGLTVRKPQTNGKPEIGGKPSRGAKAEVGHASAASTSKAGNVAHPAKAPKPPQKPVKAKTDRARDSKNKGAPKWLKEKREKAADDNKQ